MDSNSAQLVTLSAHGRDAMKRSAQLAARPYQLKSQSQDKVEGRVPVILAHQRQGKVGSQRALFTLPFEARQRSHVASRSRAMLVAKSLPAIP